MAQKSYPIASRFFQYLIQIVACLQGSRSGLFVLSFFFAGLLVLLLPKRMMIAASNLSRVYPGSSRSWRFRTVMAHLLSMGQGIVEAMLAWTQSKQWWLDRLEVVGGEELEAALSLGKGVILLTPHLHTFEVIPRVIASVSQPIHLVYHQSRMQEVGEIVEGFRSQYAQCLAHTDVREIRRVLRSGQALGLLPDQCMRDMAQVKVPFLGVPSWTITSPVRLRARSQAPVVLVYCQRLVFSKRYRLVCYRVPESRWTGEVAKDTEILNDLLSEVILRFPSQYYWFHRRFKSVAKATVSTNGK